MPQGDIVSSIRANIYLHYGLDLWFKKVAEVSCQGKAMMCRYADEGNMNNSGDFTTGRWNVCSNGSIAEVGSAKASHGKPLTGQSSD